MSEATCQTTEPLLQAYLDGELDIEEGHQVEGHLRACGECTLIREELSELGGRLRSLHKARETTEVAVDVEAAPAPESEGDAAVQSAVAAWSTKKNKPTPSSSGALSSGMGSVGAGERIGGYRVEGTIAKGGMGTVYRATQLSMDRPVALKVLAPHLSASEKYVARFLREAKVAATISHPSLVAIYDVGQEGDRLYYSMELVEGEDVEEVLRRDGRVPQRKAMEIAREVALALSVAAERSVVHRDIKPANILLTQDGGVKLADLGLAKDLDDQDSTLTRSKTIIGSPNYMSPEQAEDLRKATHRSDIYMLGATLLHMVTGEVPFGEGSPIEVLARVLRDPATIPDVVGGEALDPRLREVIERCLEKDPEARFESAQQLGAVLADCLSSAAPAAPRRASRRSSARRSGRQGRSPSSEGRVRQMGRSSSEGRVRSLETGKGRVQRGGGVPPALIAAAAALVIGAIGFGLVVGSGGDGSQDSTAQAEGDSLAPSAPVPTAPPAPAPQQPEAPTPAPEPVISPAPAPAPQPEPEVAKADPTGQVELAALLRFRDEHPEQLGEVWRRANGLADTYSDASGLRAREVADSAETRLHELLDEASEEAQKLEGQGRLWAARDQYADFLSDQGDDAPCASRALLAQRALEQHVEAKLTSDRERLGELVRDGDMGGAEQLLAKVSDYAGEDRVGQLRADMGGALAARPKEDEAPAPQGDAAEPQDAAEPAAAEKPPEEALALLDRVDEALAEGKLDQADRLLERWRETFGGVEALKERAEALVASAAEKRKEGEGPATEVLLAALLRCKVEALEDGRFSFTYPFKREDEAQDWQVKDAPKDWGQSRLYDFMQREAKHQGQFAPWGVKRGHLVGGGYERVRHLVTFDGDQPIDVELDAKGQQNLLVVFDANQDVVAGVGYMLNTLRLAQLGGGMRGNREVRKFAERLQKTIDRSREQGPCVAIFREKGLFQHGDEHDAEYVPGRLKKRSKFSVHLFPSDAGEKYREVEVRAGKKVLAGKPIEDAPRGKVRVALATMGSVVGYNSIRLSGKPHKEFLEQLRQAYKEAGEPEKLREAFLEREAKKKEKDAKEREEERERRERERRERDDD